MIIMCLSGMEAMIGEPHGHAIGSSVSSGRSCCAHSASGSSASTVSMLSDVHAVNAVTAAARSTPRFVTNEKVT
jgi:hypothetical protein